jgi:imidazolonepropionase-like amidohydrolase
MTPTLCCHRQCFRGNLVTLLKKLMAAWIAFAAMGTAHALPEAASAAAYPTRIAIVGVRIIPADDKPVIDNGVILIEDGIIRASGTRERIFVPADHQVFDWSGLTVLPGYWNSHVHLTTPVYLRAPDLTDADLEAELTRTFTRWGFTSVFDLASTTSISGHIAQRVDSGAVRGPKVLSVAEPFYPANGTPIYARPFYEAFHLPSAEVSSAEAAAARARAQVRTGADGLKLFTGAITGETEVTLMPAEIVRAVSNVGESEGVPVFAHPTYRQGLERAVDNGGDVLAHAAPLMGEWTPAYARWLAKRKVAMTPTLSLFEIEPHPLTPVSVAIQQTRALHKAGGTILFGTDAGFVEQFSPELEMVLLEKAVGWRGVIAALTSAPAALFGNPRTQGKIKVGYAADLVAVGCAPERNIRCLADVRQVMRNGDVIHTMK